MTSFLNGDLFSGLGADKFINETAIQTLTGVLGAAAIYTVSKELSDEELSIFSLKAEEFKRHKNLFYRFKVVYEMKRVSAEERDDMLKEILYILYTYNFIVDNEGAGTLPMANDCLRRLKTVIDMSSCIRLRVRQMRKESEDVSANDVVNVDQALFYFEKPLRNLVISMFSHVQSKPVSSISDTCKKFQ